VLRDLRELFGKHAPLAWRELHWPLELAESTASGLLRQVGGDAFVSRLVLEADVSQPGVLYRLGVPAPSVERITELIPLVAPGTAVTRTRRDLAVDEAWKIIVTSRQRPLKSTDAEAITRSILGAMTGIHGQERIVLQWLLGPTHVPRHVRARELSERPGIWDLLLHGQHRPDPDQRRALHEKRRELAFGCVGRLGITGGSPSRRRALAVGALAALRTASAPGVTVRLVRETPERIVLARSPLLWPYALNVTELLPLLAWPLGRESLPGVPRDQSRRLRPDERVRPRGRVLGRSSAPGDNRLLGLGIEDARQHLHVIGPTGVGKSTLLANLILQDAVAGRSVVVVEPKGDLVEDVLARLPAERVDDVVLLDPADTTAPVGLNPLIARGRSPELVADQVLAVFHGLWSSNWGPRLQDILHSSLLTLAGRNDATLCLLPALLTNPMIRQRLRAELDDPVALEPFWAWFDSISDAERQQAIAPVLNKLRPFLLRPSVRTIVGQVQPRFRIDELFTGRKIVLVSLAKGLIGPEAAALLGSLFIAELWQAILGRAAVAPSRRHVVPIYLDEFQDYTHLPTDMSDALAQARGLGAALNLSHQHLAQLPTGVRAAVLANARSRVCFQLASEDAQTLARFAGGKLEPRDFQRLHRFEAYAQLVVDGEVTEFASIKTLPLPAASTDTARIRAISRDRFGRSAQEVDAEIRRLIEDPGVDAPVGRRRRSQR
jgi:hypothetical protein